MNKQIVLVIIGFFIITGGVLLFLKGKGTNESEKVISTPTPTPVYEKVSDSVKANLSLRPNRKFVDLTITGMEGKFDIVEYEISYDTDKGPKGSIGKIILKKNQDNISREIELGTCSTGGTCTYHKGVKNFKLSLKFIDKKGKTYILQKDFDLL